MKKLIMGVFILDCVVVACADDIVSQVCSSVSSVVSALPAGRRGSPSYIREFGVPFKQCAGYQGLVSIVFHGRLHRGSVSIPSCCRRPALSRTS